VIIPAKPDSTLLAMTFVSTGGGSITIVDTPLLGWNVDDTDPTVAPTPVTLEALPPPLTDMPWWTPQWAWCEIGPPPELCGAVRILVATPDGTFRGYFAAFLDTLAADRWPLDASQLLNGPLNFYWWAWAFQNPSLVLPSAWQRAPKELHGFGPHPDSPSAAAA
jgi:hypothetical protein